MELSRFSDEQLRDLAVRATVHIQQLGMRVGAHDYPTWSDQLRMELTISGDVLCQVEAEQRRRVADLNIDGELQRDIWARCFRDARFR